MLVTKIFALTLLMACLACKQTNAAALPQEELKDTALPPRIAEESKAADLPKEESKAAELPNEESKDAELPKEESKVADLPKEESKDAELPKEESKDVAHPRVEFTALFADPEGEQQKADIKDAVESAVADDILPQVRGFWDALKYAGCHILGKMADPFPNPCDG